MYRTFMAFSRHPYKLSHFYTTEELRVKGLAQGDTKGSSVDLGFDITTFQTVVQRLNH